MEKRAGCGRLRDKTSQPGKSGGGQCSAEVSGWAAGHCCVTSTTEEFWKIQFLEEVKFGSVFIGY